MGGRGGARQQQASQEPASRPVFCPSTRSLPAQRHAPQASQSSSSPAFFMAACSSRLQLPQKTAAWGLLTWKAAEAGRSYSIAHLLTAAPAGRARAGTGEEWQGVEVRMRGVRRVGAWETSAMQLCCGVLCCGVCCRPFTRRRSGSPVTHTQTSARASYQQPQPQPQQRRQPQQQRRRQQRRRQRRRQQQQAGR